MQQVRAIYFWVRSFFTRSRGVSDYPVTFREHDRSQKLDDPRVVVPRWSVHIVKWPQMSGIGNTRQEALKSLADHLDAYRQQNPAMPRPGTTVPIEFASDDLIVKHEETARDFLRKILNMDYDMVFISNESSIWDFETLASRDDLRERIHDAYGIEVPESGNFASIFHLIERNQASA